MALNHQIILNAHHDSVERNPHFASVPAPSSSLCDAICRDLAKVGQQKGKSRE